LLPYPKALKISVCFALAPAKGKSNTFTRRLVKKKSNRNASSVANKNIQDSLQDSKMALNCFCFKRQPGVDIADGGLGIWVGFVAESTLSERTKTKLKFQKVQRKERTALAKVNSSMDISHRHVSIGDGRRRQRPTFL